MSLVNHTNHYYYIRSKDRRSSETATNFTVPAHTLNNIRSFQIKKIIMDYSFYLINDNNNKLIIFKLTDTQDRIITISPGNYSLTELKNELVVQLNASAGPAIGPFTVTDNNITNKITITANSSTFIIRGTGSINKVLGYSRTSDTSPLISHIAPNVYSISGTNYVDVFSRTLTKYDSKVRTSARDGQNFLCSIPLSDNVPQDVIREKYHDYMFDYHPESGEDIVDIELKNDEGQPLGGSTGLNGTGEISIVLQFHSYRNNHPLVLNRNNQRRNKNNIGDRFF